MDEEKDKLLEEYYFNYGAFASPQKLFRVLNQKFPGRFSLGYIKNGSTIRKLILFKDKCVEYHGKNSERIKAKCDKKIKKSPHSA